MDEQQSSKPLVMQVRILPGALKILEESED